MSSVVAAGEDVLMSTRRVSITAKTRLSDCLLQKVAIKVIQLALNPPSESGFQERLDETVM